MLINSSHEFNAEEKKNVKLTIIVRILFFSKIAGLLKNIWNQ